jgi:hypothetical protein
MRPSDIRKNFSIGNIPNALLVCISHSSGRIISSTGMWLSHLFTMPNLTRWHLVEEKWRLHWERGTKSRSRRRLRRMRASTVANVLVKHILRILLLAQMTFANIRHQKVYILQDLIILPRCLPIKCTLQCIQRGTAGLKRVHANQAKGNLSHSSSRTSP